MPWYIDTIQKAHRHKEAFIESTQSVNAKENGKMSHHHTGHKVTFAQVPQ